MASRLEEILAQTRKCVDEAKHFRPQRELVRDSQQIKTPTRGFRKALMSAARGGVAIIAELKKKSPSKGMLRGSYPVGGLAMQLERSGAAALSVLTEEKYFDGSLLHLLEASAATNLPCLRKDFIIDEYQLYESRLNRADAVLLIAAALSEAEMKQFSNVARELSMDVLCEVHDEAELARAINAKADMIGVNCRDLRTLEVDTQVHQRLVEKLPRGVIRIAESGMQDVEDIRRLRAPSADSAGYDAFLVGELLMKADEPGAALAKLIGPLQKLDSSIVD